MIKKALLSRTGKITTLLGTANLYVIYAMAASFTVWLKQPRFILPDGSRTSSLGFLITFLIYGAIFLVSASTLTVTCILLYGKKKRKEITDSGEDSSIGTDKNNEIDNEKSNETDTGNERA